MSESFLYPVNNSLIDGLSIDSNQAESLSGGPFSPSAGFKQIINGIEVNFTYPFNYDVKEIKFDDPDTQDGKGKEIYKGIHADEYLVCEWKNHLKNGQGLLYNHWGELLFRGNFVNDKLEGMGAIYHEGCVIAELRYEHNQADYFNYIECSPDSIVLVKRSGTGEIIYRGGFDEQTFEREGWGVEYSNGALSFYGTYESDVIVNITKKFDGDNMYEYGSDQTLIYIGNYKDSFVEGFPRQGEGREYANGILQFHGFYTNNKRNGKGTLFYRYGVAQKCGFWEQGKLVWSTDMDNNGYSKDLKFDGRSIASIRVINGVEVINMNIRNMKIGSNACNSKEIQRFVLSNAPCIETISIGSNCCKNVTFFQIEDLPSLRRVTILEDSFTTFNRTTNTPINDNHAANSSFESIFQINRCPQLTEFSCGCGSFSSFRQFSLTSLFCLCFFDLDLPQFHTLVLGQVVPERVGDKDSSFCFYWAEEFRLEKLPKLEAVEVGCQSFHNVYIVSLVGIHFFAIIIPRTSQSSHFFRWFCEFLRKPRPNARIFDCPNAGFTIAFVHGAGRYCILQYL